jgi:HD superfamily phosphohydrolase
MDFDMFLAALEEYFTFKRIFSDHDMDQKQLSEVKSRVQKTFDAYVFAKINSERRHSQKLNVADILAAKITENNEEVRSLRTISEAPRPLENNKSKEEVEKWSLEYKEWFDKRYK